MVEITTEPIRIDETIKKAATSDSGCIATYVGLIRDNNREKKVQTVEYRDTDGTAVQGLQQIEDEIRTKWPVNNMAIVHRIGVLQIGDCNLLIAIACGHRGEAFAATAYAVDRFKELLPAKKLETYVDGSTWKVGL